MRKKISKGFSLVEVMVGVAVFVLFVVGVYSTIQFVFKIVYSSRLRIIETGILNEQIEIVRNMPYQNVGIINGSPSGTLTRNVSTTRNGIDFLITRTIRNIDDPFDGTIDGIPKDTAPADYKLVEVEVICTKCEQKYPVRMVTTVAPKLLEGDPTHGALFIRVFDANAVPVVGATVHVVATSTNPQVDLTDVTDNDGMLRLVDLGAGLNAYNITVSKSGYTTDQTLLPSVSVSNPVKPPASVVAQDVTEISFSIDHASTLAISTINASCNIVSGAPVRILGTKLIGTEPDVLKIDYSANTDAGGTHTFSNLDWDSYGLKPSGYDLIGSIPVLPISLAPGASQPSQLILGANTANSLLINIVDSVTGQPLSNATVRVTATDYDQTKTTGVGFVRQTDWSGGSGQVLFTNETKYFSDDGKIDASTPVGDIKLRKVGKNYVSVAELESSTLDLGVNANPVNLLWTPLSQPPETGVNSLKFQLAASSSSTPASWNYVGYDGTASTYFDSTHQVISETLNNKRYIRYKVFLSTDSSAATPVLSDLSLTYVTSCTPPGQAYFGSLSEVEYTIDVTRDGYQTKTEKVTVSGDMVFSMEMAYAE